MESNVYEAPEAELTTSGGEQPVLKMKRFSAWGVFGLMVVTLGIYQLYWMYNRSVSINSILENKISSLVLNGFYVTYFLSIVVQFLVEPMGSAGVVVLAIITLVYIVAYLALLFTIRSRLIEITGEGVNPVMTFFFHVIYMQYKINKAYDAAE